MKSLTLLPKFTLLKTPFSWFSKFLSKLEIKRNIYISIIETNLNFHNWDLGIVFMHVASILWPVFFYWKKSIIIFLSNRCFLFNYNFSVIKLFFYSKCIWEFPNSYLTMESLSLNIAKISNWKLWCRFCE